jgi:hypothetical protein
MLIRFPHSSLVALAAAYILLPTAAPDSQLNVTRKEPPHVLLIDRAGVRGITLGSLVMGISLFFCRSPWPEIGLALGILGGATSLLAGLACAFGIAEWREEYIAKLTRMHQNLLEKVFERYGIDSTGSQEIRDLVDGKRATVRFDTAYGKLVTMRKGDGYYVELRRGEKAVRVDLVRGTDIGDEWTEKAVGMVTKEWAELVELYK